MKYAGVGLVGAASSLFSPDLQPASGIAALMVFMAAHGESKWVRKGLTVLAPVVGASAGAITYSIGFFLLDAALSAAVRGGIGLGLGYAMTGVKDRIRGD